MPAGSLKILMKPALHFKDEDILFPKLPSSDSRISHLSSTKPSLISFSIPLCLRPSIPTSFQFHKVLDLLLEPEGLLSNSSVLQSLAIVVIVLFPTFSLRSCLRHHPGTLIYKLAAKAWLIPTPPSSFLNRRLSVGEIALERLRGKREKRERLAGI